MFASRLTLDSLPDEILQLIAAQDFLLSYKGYTQFRSANQKLRSALATLESDPSFVAGVILNETLQAITTKDQNALVWRAFVDKYAGIPLAQKLLNEGKSPELFAAVEQRTGALTTPIDVVYTICTTLSSADMDGVAYVWSRYRHLLLPALRPARKDEPDEKDLADHFKLFPLLRLTLEIAIARLASSSCTRTSAFVLDELLPAMDGVLLCAFLTGRYRWGYELLFQGKGVYDMVHGNPLGMAVAYGLDALAAKLLELSHGAVGEIEEVHEVDAEDGTTTRPPTCEDLYVVEALAYTQAPGGCSLADFLARLRVVDLLPGGVQTAATAATIIDRVRGLIRNHKLLEAALYVSPDIPREILDFLLDCVMPPPTPSLQVAAQEGGGDVTDGMIYAAASLLRSDILRRMLLWRRPSLGTSLPWLLHVIARRPWRDPGFPEDEEERVLKERLFQTVQTVVEYERIRVGGALEQLKALSPGGWQVQSDSGEDALLTACSSNIVNMMFCVQEYIPFVAFASIADTPLLLDSGSLGLWHRSPGFAWYTTMCKLLLR